MLIWQDGTEWIVDGNGIAIPLPSRIAIPNLCNWFLKSGIRDLNRPIPPPENGKWDHVLSDNNENMLNMTV